MGRGSTTYKVVTMTRSRCDLTPGEARRFTHATLETDVALGGRVAAMGRGVIADVSARLVQTSAGNLAEMLEGGGTAAAVPEPALAGAAASASAPAATADERSAGGRARRERRGRPPVGSEVALRRGGDLCDDLPRDRLPRGTGQMIIAHIAGIPVEESLLSLGPVGLVGISVAVRSVLAKFRRAPDAP
jgi:hypothetical protein